MTTEVRTTTIVNEIDTAKESIRRCRKKMMKIEKSMKLNKLTDEERTLFEEELRELRGLLRQQELGIKSLRGENRRTWIVCVLIVVLLFCMYGLYVQIMSTVPLNLEQAR